MQVNKPAKMTRCEFLCRLHGVMGGTIHQYNKLWSSKFRANIDFNLMPEPFYKQMIFHITGNYTTKELTSLILKVA